jgi:hypothetical protein
MSWALAPEGSFFYFFIPFAQIVARKPAELSKDFEDTGQTPSYRLEGNVLDSKEIKRPRPASKRTVEELSRYP